MQIKLNGNSRETANGSTVNDLLGQLNLKPDNVAIELNKKLLRSDKYDATLNDGDVVEIVTFIGGG